MWQQSHLEQVFLQRLHWVMRSSTQHSDLLFTGSNRILEHPTRILLGAYFPIGKDELGRVQHSRHCWLFNI
jgi:hypothetical protein